MRYGFVLPGGTATERLEQAVLRDRRMTFSGRHYQVDLGERQDLAAVGAPVQRPRIPIWVVAAWPRPA